MRCYPVGSAVNSCEGTPVAGGVARRVRQAAAVGLIAIFAVGCAVSNRIALPPLPQVDVLVLLQASLGPGGAGQAYAAQTISTNLSSTGSAILSACGFVSPPGTAPGNNVVPRGLQITVGTPPGGATNTGCTISGRIDSAVAPGTYVFTVRAADNNAPPQVDDETYSIVVSSLVITLGPNPASTVTGETFAVTWSFTVVGSPANPNQSVLVELVNAANVVEDSCTAAIGAGGCGGLTSPAAGNKTIRLTYPAPGQMDPNFPAGGGASRAHTVTAASTTTTITDAPDPSVSGQQYTVNVTVAPVAPGAGAPTSNVSVSDGLGNNCVAALTPGANQSSGSCLLNGPTAGGRTLTASYAGDANYSASVGTDAHTVNPAPTTTTITSDVADPSVVGQAYTINVTVAVNAPGAGTPTGVVATNDGQGVMCNATLAAGPGANQASGSCSLTSLTTAANTLTASYPGDANFAASADTETHTVTPAPTTTTINSIVPAASLGFSVSGESYAVNFTVASSAGVGEPTGSVTADDGAGQSCTGALTPGAPGSGMSTGSCALQSASASGPGPMKTITATYPSPPAAGSDPNFIGSSGTAAHTVNPADTATVNVSSSGLVGGIRTSQFQESVTFTATVTIVAPGSATPVGLSGTVDFVNITAVPATNLCIGVALTAGMATCVVSNLATLAPTGLIHSIEARYDTGNTDLNFNSSTGTERQQVVPAATQTVVASSVNPSTSPQAVTFTATVTVPGPGSGSPIAPTGTVAFFDGSTPFLGCVAQTLSSGQAACTVPNALDLVALSTGPHSITAAYSGDTNFATSASPVLVQMVNTAPTITPIVLGDGVEARAVGAGSSGLAGVRFPISGGTPPYTCSDPGGTLPPGINVVLATTGADCELQGTPTLGAAAGSYMVDITVTDANTASDTTGPITWDINVPLAITDPAGLADAVEDRSYTFTFNSTMLGGNGPYTWSESGASLGLADCAGFSIAANGDLTGTQPLVAGGGTCMFTVQVADTASTTTMAGSATQAETIVVQPMLTIVTTNLANALRNSVYLPTGQPGAVVQSTGGTGTPFTYDVSAGNFICLAGTCTGIPTTPCQGLSFAQTAVDAGSGAAVDTIIAGTPVNAGACSLTIRVTDGGSGPTASGSAAQALTIQVLDNFVYVADPANDQVNVLRVDTSGLAIDTEVTTISTGGATTNPHSVAITAGGAKAYVTLEGSNQVLPINTVTNTAGTAINLTGCVGPRGIDIGRAGAALNIAFVACADDGSGTAAIITIDTTTDMQGSSVSGITGAAVVNYVAIAPDGARAFASRESRDALSLNTSTLVATPEVDLADNGGVLRGVVVSADSGRVYFADSANNEVQIRSASNLATQIDCVPGGGTDECAMGAGSAPEGLALSLNGSLVFVALNGTGSFGVINESTSPTVNASSPVLIVAASGPFGVATPPGTNRVYFTLNTADAVARHDDASPFASSGAPVTLSGTLASTPQGAKAIPIPQ